MSDLNSRDEQMAEEVGIMAELGRFEKEFTMYGCAYFENGKVMYAVSENAEKIYDFIYDIVNEDKLPTDIHAESIRTLVPSGAEPYILSEVRKRLLDKLYALYDEVYFSCLYDMQNTIRTDDAYQMLKELQYQFDGVCNREQLQIFQGLLETAYRRKILRTESYMELLQWIGWINRDLELELEKTDLYEKEFYGFAYLKDGEPLKIYVDGYKNNVYKRMEQKRAEGYEISNMIRKKYWYNSNFSVVQAKKKCEKCFALLFKQWYTDFIKQMGRIISPISQNRFQNLVLIQKEKNISLYKSVIRQGAIWNIHDCNKTT